MVRSQAQGPVATEKASAKPWPSSPRKPHGKEGPVSERAVNEPAANDINPKGVVRRDRYPACSEHGEELTLHSWDFQQSRRAGPHAGNYKGIWGHRKTPSQKPSSCPSGSPRQNSASNPQTPPRRSHPARGSVAQRFQGGPVPGVAAPGRRWTDGGAGS